jgi:hypothetical protein
VFEFLESGSILTSARFDPLNLFGEIGSIASFGNGCILMTMLFVVYFMIVQFRECANISLYEYWCDFWSYIEWSIIISAWISFFMFILRYIKAQEVLSFFNTTQGYGYINLQRVNLYNQILTYSLALCSSLSSVKFIKMLRFNKNIAFLGLTLKNCFGELISFTFIFFIVWFSFVQVMFLVYGSDMLGYSSIMNSMDTAFQVMIGKADVSQIQKGGLKYLGPMIFSAYNVVVTFFALNIFISIITDSFAKVRDEAKAHPNKLDFIDIYLEKLQNFLKINKSEKKVPENYMSNKSCSGKLDGLSSYVLRVSKLFDVLLILNNLKKITLKIKNLDRRDRELFENVHGIYLEQAKSKLALRKNLHKKYTLMLKRT